MESHVCACSSPYKQPFASICPVLGIVPAPQAHGSVPAAALWLSCHPAAVTDTSWELVLAPSMIFLNLHHDPVNWVPIHFLHKCQLRTECQALCQVPGIKGE